MMPGYLVVTVPTRLTVSAGRQVAEIALILAYIHQLSVMQPAKIGSGRKESIQIVVCI